MAKDWIKANKTPQRFVFKLISSSKGEIPLNTAPLEWAETSLKLKRDIDKGGVFFSYSDKTLTFIKEGYSFLKELFDLDDINAQCDLYIYELDRTSFEYVQFPITFALDFRFYKLAKIESVDIQLCVQIKAVSSSEQTKFENRKDKDIDLINYYLDEYSNYVIDSLGGFQIIDWANFEGRIYSEETNNYYAGRVSNYVYQYFPRQPGFTAYYTPAINLDYSDFEEMQSTAYVWNAVPANLNSFFDSSLYERDVTINYSFYFEVHDKDSYNVWYVHLIHYDSGDNVKADHELLVCGTSKELYIVEGSEDFTLEIGDRLSFIVETKDRQDISGSIRNVYIYASESVVQTAETLFQSLPVYEALERAGQLMLDKQYPIYSEFLGRTDTPYNFDDDTYSSENQLRFLNVMSGLNIRGGDLYDENISIPMTFKKLFHAISCVYNLGYTFEIIEGSTRLRIENYDYFFQDSIILDLSDRLTDYDIETEVLPEYAYLQINSGYKKYEYEAINGRMEYNTNNTRTSILNSEAEYDNVSELRADSKGIYTLLISPLSGETTGTTDVKGDDDVFMIKTQQDTIEIEGTPTDLWVPEKQENITIENNSSVYQDDSLNLYLTPTRNLMRHGNKLKSALYKRESSKLYFQTSSKLQTLETTGESYTIKENDDILVDDLDDPIFKIMMHTVTISLSIAERNLLLNNPLKLIKFTDNISGWLLDYTQDNSKQTVEISIIEKYVS